jgi:hypothetical protein
MTAIDVLMPNCTVDMAGNAIGLTEDLVMALFSYAFPADWCSIGESRFDFSHAITEETEGSI